MPSSTTGSHSQRHLASELGIALGLVNAYLKRCVKKGLVKMGEAPARRYAYYLTPQGFAEKSRLTVEYLSYSFSFFRQAKTDCAALLQAAKARGVDKILLVGRSDLAEIAALCAMEQGVQIIGLVQDGAGEQQFVGVPVFKSFDTVSSGFDLILVTDVADARGYLRRCCREVRRGACSCAGHVAGTAVGTRGGRGMIVEGQRWYVVQSQPNAEAKAVQSSQPARL